MNKSLMHSSWSSQLVTKQKLNALKLVVTVRDTMVTIDVSHSPSIHNLPCQTPYTCMDAAAAAAHLRLADSLTDGSIRLLSIGKLTRAKLITLTSARRSSSALST